MPTDIYKRKRDFSKTPEPKGQAKRKPGRGHLTFVVQKHAASRLHYDLRLEVDGVYKSWAVPKEPTLNPTEQRLAVQTEDHPLEYGKFAGEIPKGNYGAGRVEIWDEGTYLERGSQAREDSEKAMRKALEKGHVTVVLDGKKLKGEFALIRLKKDATGKAWLMVKKRDEHATYRHANRKVPDTKHPKAPPAKKASMPRRNRPMLATPATEAPKTWLREADPRGLRALAEIEPPRVSLYSKSGLSFAKKYPEIVAELAKQKHAMVLDGEIAQDVYHVYDLLYLDGKDLRDQALKDRRASLGKAFAPTAHVRLNGRGADIAKNPTSPYRAGTSKDWVRLSGTPITDDQPRFTNTDKVYFPQDDLTKGDVIAYYRAIAPHILPHLKDRPLSLNRHPDGITSQGFYQKDMTGQHPRWLHTHRIESSKSINYVLAQDERSLLYLANLGCIEFNPWFSRIEALDRPDFLVIDLDPDDGNTFGEVVEVARTVHAILERLKVPNFVKTSGATGLHIGVPTEAKYEFDQVRGFALEVVRRVHAKHPRNTSLERSPVKRRNKIYLDYMQNRRAQTLACAYCLRPRDGAPVSTPLKWSEVNARLDPKRFHIGNALSRVRKMGDLWAGVLGSAANLERALRHLRKD